MERTEWNGEKSLLNSDRCLLSRAAQFQAASFPKKGKIGQSTAFWGGMARNLWWQEALSVERVRKVYGWNGKKRP